MRRPRLVISCFALAASVAAGIPLAFGGAERRADPARDVTPSPAAACPFELPRGTTIAAARKVAVLFMLTTIMRGEPACGFDVASAELRGKLSRRQWSRGDPPVVPFRTRRPRRATFSLVPQARPQAVLDQRGRFVLPLYLTLRAPDAAEVTYDLRLVRGPGRWLVDRCSPRPGTGVAPSLKRHKSPVTGRTSAAV